VEEASRNILQAMCESQGWDLGTMWRLDSRANVLRCVDVWCPPDINAAEFERFVRETTYPKEIGLPGMVWAKGEPLWYSDVLKEADFPEASIIAKQGLSGACGFPITGEQGVTGVLAFYSRRVWPLNKNLMMLMTGTASQISQGLETERAIFQQRELTALERGMAEFLGEGLMAMDRDGFCIYANSASGHLLGVSSKQLLGRHVPDFLQPDGTGNAGSGSSPLRLSLQNTKPAHFMREQFFRKNDGTLLPVLFTTSPIIDKGLIQGVVITFLDATDLNAALEEHQERLSEKEREIQALKEALLESQNRPPEASPSAELLEKIRGLLKDFK
jgi:PAS domain S-box-containing protein